jgi:hypothetical protein
MQKTITFEDDGRFIYCKYTGRFDVKPLIDLAAEVNGHVNSKQSQAVLVDITDSHGFMETYQRFQHGHYISKFVNHDVKIALLARIDQTFGRFWENTTRSRNLNIKVFTKKHKAENWLN